MKKLVLTMIAAVAMAAPAAFAVEHGGHAGHSMSGSAQMAGVAHEEIIDGVRATFSVQTMQDAMAAMGMQMPAGVKETHHISLKLVHLKTGKAVAGGEAKLKVIAPNKSEQVKDMMVIHGHFGSDVVMTAKGRYGVLSKFKTPDGKVRSAKFWYQNK